ncbi:MAG TPA: hypothetical protein VFL62_18620, partial [Bradyrhizobium sp.]|uniref:hypothetical protein n=1 Tax=Bradyrhizobium sp. TaxID=376 RepID=UPI002D7ED75A
MKIASAAIIGLVFGSMQPAFAQAVRWSSFTIPETGTSVEIPASIFSDRAGRAGEGYGQRFQTHDRRANLTIQTTANVSSETPAAFLAKMHPPQRIQYKRVTSRFFVV